jgi:hypothetical protein
MRCSIRGQHDSSSMLMVRTQKRFIRVNSCAFAVHIYWRCGAGLRRSASLVGRSTPNRDLWRGKILAQQNGAGQPDVGIPRLAGLTSSYIAAQLEYFATGARHDPVMSPYAAMLTPVQRQAVADYFASLRVPEKPDLVQASAARVDVMPIFEGFMKVPCGSRHECP